MMNAVVVGGRFDNQGGKPSGYAGKLHHYLAARFKSQSIGCTLLNGGKIGDLGAFVLSDIGLYKFVIWMPDIQADLDLRPALKVACKKSILVMSKNNIDGRYSPTEIIGKALQMRCNLILAISGESPHFIATIYDPLGNKFVDPQYSDDSTSISMVSNVLFRRIMQLALMTRVPSSSSAPDRTLDGCSNLFDFFDVTQKHAARFQELIVGSNRFPGNVSLRCPAGFPGLRSNRSGGLAEAWISPRNTSKKSLTAVDMILCWYGGDQVCYCGSRKPSVDTPVQLLLYKRFPDLNYMLHSHVYAVGYPVTSRVIPCGALEELHDIGEVIGDRASSFAVNLRGHGSLVFSDSVDFIDKIRWEPRKLPEAQSIWQ